MCCPHNPSGLHRPIASLRDTRAFRHVYQGGRHAAGPLFVIYARKQETAAHPRLGLSVSKKVGGAVTRNRVKRLIKESCRLRGLSGGRDYIVVARASAGLLTRATAFAQINAELGGLFKRLNA